MRSLRKTLGLVVGLILASILSSTLAFAQHAAKGDNGANGQQVAADNTDKQTGKLRQPSAEETKQLLDGIAALVSTSIEGLVPKYHENGMVSVDLQDRFQSVAVAKIGADGKVEQRCVTSPAEAKEFLTNESKKEAQKPAPALEEK